MRAARHQRSLQPLSERECGCWKQPSSAGARAASWVRQPCLRMVMQWVLRQSSSAGAGLFLGLVGGGLDMDRAVRQQGLLASQGQQVCVRTGVLLLRRKMSSAAEGFPYL